MPRSTLPAHYGPEFEQLLLRAYEPVTGPGSGGLSFDLPSPERAIALRNKVYAYFKSLRTANTRPDLIQKSTALTMSCSGSTLSIYRVEDSVDNVFLRGALGLDKGAPLPLPEQDVGLLPVPTSQELLRTKLEDLRRARGASSSEKKGE